MPFISEELYQRLPRADGPASICVAPYPGILAINLLLTNKFSNQYFLEQYSKHVHGRVKKLKEK